MSEEYVVIESGCWQWQKSLQRNGYGQAYRPGSRIPQRAHRVYYEEHVGPIPDGLQIDHLCGNRACVNPAHLEPVTNAENCRRGSRTRLTADDVCAIRSEPRRWGVCIDLAARFGVTVRYVRDLRRGYGWSDVSKHEVPI